MDTNNNNLKVKSGKSPRKFSPEFKFNVVLESFITGNAAETSARHDIHVTQLNAWRRLLKQKGTGVFNLKNDKDHEYRRKIDQMEKIIGRVTIENEILKKTQEMIG